MDEGDIENNDTASLVGQHLSWEGPRTGVESVVGEDVIPEGEEFTFPARPVEFQTVDRTISDARDVRVSPRGSDHAHERPENVVGNESDTDSMEFEVEGSMASGDEEEVVPSLEFVMPNVERDAVQLAFQRLDSVNLRGEFRMRASVMKTVPGFLQGPYRQAMHVALDEICVGLDRSDTVRQERGWKLLMLLPRMLLQRPARGGLIAKDKLSRRFEDFVHGRWSHLIDDGRICAEQSSKDATRKRRRVQHDDVERRAARAEALVQMGELSAGRQALEGEALALSNECTLHQLQRGPAVPRHQMPEDLERFWAGRRFELDEKQFSKNLRSFRRGAAVGPSGMTAEHLRPLLNAPRILHLLFRASESLAAAQVPQSTVDVLKLGRITALQKARGGVRGIVAGDIVRRLVSRTMAQQSGPEVERATAPFQYAMRTRAGCECVAHSASSL